MAEPEFLRLLAINDEKAPALKTNLVKIVRVANGEGEGEEHLTDRVSHWLQHVHLLGTGAIPDFDLLFIDIKFHEDRYAPKYGDGEVNPLGLLHALTFAAKRDSAQGPFVWGIHSGEPKSVKNDPIAIIVFSLLAALERRGEAAEEKVDGRPWKWDDVGIHNADVWSDDKRPNAAERHFSKAIANLPKGGSEVIWEKMMRQYREKFLDYVDEDRMFVDPVQVGTLLIQARGRSKDDLTRLASATLDVFGSLGKPWTRRISLQSLFADEVVTQTTPWPEDKCGELVKFLTRLKNMGASGKIEDWFPIVEAHMKKLDKKTRVLKNITPKMSKRQQRTLGALMIICWWLGKKAYTYNAKDLLEAFGYGNNDRQVVEDSLAFLEFETLTPFFVYLEKTPDQLPPPFWRIGLRWWKEKCDGTNATAPACIRPAGGN